MVRIPPEILAQLDRNHRRQQRGGVIEAAVGALIGGGALASTIGRAHRGWYPTAESIPQSRKRLRGQEFGLESSKQIKNDEGEPAKVWKFKGPNPSLPDSTSSAQVAMADGGGSGNAQGLKETPVDDPFVVYRGPPDFTFASLPFVREEFPSFDDTWSYDFIFRMTSPYDTMHEATTVTDLNAGLGTANAYSEATTDTLVRTARWFNYYAGLYKYYHVVSCRWKIFVENLSMEPLYVHQMYCNDTIPPLGATNEDIILWSDTRTQYINPIGYAVNSVGQAEIGFAADSANNNNANQENQPASTTALATFESGNNIAHPGASICTFTGQYRPGDFRREIRLDSEVENWTLCTTNPALPERLVVRIKPVNAAIDTNNATNYGDDIKFRIRMELDYLVEFKELVDGLRWPVQRQPLTVTIAQDIESAN